MQNIAGLLPAAAAALALPSFTAAFALAVFDEASSSPLEEAQAIIPPPQSKIAETEKLRILVGVMGVPFGVYNPHTKGR